MITLNSFSLYKVKDVIKIVCAMNSPWYEGSVVRTRDVNFRETFFWIREFEFPKLNRVPIGSADADSKKKCGRSSAECECR